MNKKATEKKEVIKLESYTIKAIIPTVQYGNIQAEITVSAKTLDGARSHVMPHIESLYAQYLNFGIVKNVTTSEPKAPLDIKTINTAPVESAVHTENYKKALGAIESCKSKASLE